MKKLFRKNQVIITALAIMIAVAGYLNYSGVSLKDAVNTKDRKEQESAEVSQDEIQDLLDEADISDEDSLLLNDNGEIAETSKTESDKQKDEEKANADASEKEETKDSEGKDAKTSDSSEKEDDEASAETGKEDAGKAVMVTNNVTSDYFSAAKLSREQTRAKNKETLLEIVSNKNTTDKQKEAAVNQIVGMTAASEKETQAEAMLEAKGFSDVVVSIIDGEVDVVVNANSLSDQQIAQIEDIVKRKADVTADKIVISPVGVKDE